MGCGYLGGKDMELWRSVSGTIQVELISADPAAALYAIQKQGISMDNIEKTDEFTLTLEINRGDWVKLSQLAEKRSDTVSVKRKRGLYWAALRLKKRPILTIGILLLLLISCYLPRRIFFVQVEGNYSVPSRLIAEKAAECGVVFGANRREVRSEKIKNALLEAIPQLSWAGINTKGCTAIITVREREVTEQLQQNAGIVSIVAAQDGVVRDITVRKGNALCTAGQVVKRGQILISGYTDCGICIRATSADGEIFAETKRMQQAIMHSVFQIRRQPIAEKKKYSLIIGKKRIFFANSSGISDTSCAKIYEEKYMTLPGGFLLPVAVAVETWIYYETGDTVHPEADGILLAYSRDYLLAHMCAGTVLAATEQISANEEIVSLYAGYSCYEMIGITRIEENVLDYGKND